MSMATSGLVAVAGVFAIGLIIGLIVLMNAEDSVTAVARTAARDISGSFWVGVLWQLLAVPLLVALLLACVITIVGIFITPLIVLGWALAYFGAFTLGISAVAIVTGRAIAGRGQHRTSRAIALRSLVVGMLALSVLWFVAALLVNVGMVGALARLVAVALSWAAATVGLGAVVKSRAGMVRMQTETTAERGAPSWQTPTPVAGVVAARRPVTAPLPHSTHLDE
jgi:predicted permease